MIQEMRYEASLHKEIGEFLFTEANWKPAKQASDVQDLLTKTIDLLIIGPISEAVGAPLIADAAKRGIPVVTLGAYGFAHSTGTTNLTAATTSDVEHNFGVRYKTPWFSVFGTYQLRKPSDSPTDRLWQAGVQIPIGVANSVRVAYGSLNNGATNGTSAWDTDSDAKTWAIAGVHTLSKSTLAYVFYQRLYNSGKSRMALYPPGGISSANVANANETAWGIGLQHRF